MKGEKAMEDILLEMLKAFKRDKSLKVNADIGYDGENYHVEIIHDSFKIRQLPYDDEMEQ